jgi:hypothetical protein
LGEFVAAVAEETQTPVDVGGSVALAVLATAAGGRSVVHVRGNWREPTNLYTVVALPPGNRKSAVFSLLTGPLYEAENEAVRRGHLGKNPVLLAKAPKTGDHEVEPYTVQEVQRLLKAADPAPQLRTVGRRPRARSASRGGAGLAVGGRGP